MQVKIKGGYTACTMNCKTCDKSNSLFIQKIGEKDANLFILARGGKWLLSKSKSHAAA